MILDKILADKRIEVEARKADTSLNVLKARVNDAPPVRGFAAAVSCRPSAASSQLPVAGEPPRSEGPILLCKGDSTESRGGHSEIRLIAEVKKASPSKGLIRPDFDPVEIGKTYERAGASAISVLTDEKYFQGHLDYLKAVREAVGIPVLRKDFIIDSHQIYEARAAGADAVLLIVAALSEAELSEFMTLAGEIGMASLVEVHAAEELDIALRTGAKIIGINNRNLRTFETKLETTLELAAGVPGDRTLVGESGIFTRSDVERLMEAGVDAILVGESLMREPDPGVKVRELLGEFDSSDRSD